MKDPPSFAQEENNKISGHRNTFTERKGKRWVVSAQYKHIQIFPTGMNS